MLLERVLRNLLGNAFKYTEKGEVSLEYVAIDDTVELRVRDTGIAGSGLAQGIRCKTGYLYR